jgi:hypothetical protein
MRIYYYEKKMISKFFKKEIKPTLGNTITPQPSNESQKNTLP